MKFGMNKNTGFASGGLAAFSRVDLLAVIVGVGVLVVCFVGLRWGERVRMIRCAHNLQVLSKAMQEFATDHGDGLPPAGVEATATTWDLLLTPYVTGARAKTKSPPETVRQFQPAMAPRIFCPSDPIPRGERPRSYAMSDFDMKPDNWPPGPDCATGVGLWWSNNRLNSLLGAKTSPENLDALALVKFTGLSDPAATLLLTEYPQNESRGGSLMRITVSSPSQQSEKLQVPGRYHFGRFNYLMADGRVEWLSALQTGSLDGSSGIWSIKKGD